MDPDVLDVTACCAGRISAGGHLLHSGASGVSSSGLFISDVRARCTGLMSAAGHSLLSDF